MKRHDSGAFFVAFMLTVILGGLLFGAFMLGKRAGYREAMKPRSSYLSSP